MNCKFINAIMFAAGAAIGSVVTWKVVKTRYDKLVQEEIESVKEAYQEMMTIREDETASSDNDDSSDEEDRQSINWAELEDLDESDDENDLEEYASLVENYTNEKGGADRMADAPYVISPYDFGELDDYHQIELTYYEGDDTLEDEEGNVITDRNDLLGPKALFTFGEYEDDAVFVRNERLRTDFQILKDYRKYSEARSIGPDQVDA